MTTAGGAGRGTGPARASTLGIGRAAAAALIVLACAPGAVAGGVRSGLYGLVTRGPVAPVCAAEQPCSKPFAGAVLVFSRGGGEVARATADATGHYRVRLAPGAYAVRVTRGRLEAAATVRRGTFTRADFDVDTGIR